MEEGDLGLLFASETSNGEVLLWKLMGIMLSCFFHASIAPDSPPPPTQPATVEVLSVMYDLELQVSSHVRVEPNYIVN